MENKHRTLKIVLIAIGCFIGSICIIILFFISNSFIFSAITSSSFNFLGQPFDDGINILNNDGDNTEEDKSNKINLDNYSRSEYLNGFHYQYLMNDSYLSELKNNEDLDYESLFDIYGALTFDYNNEEYLYKNNYYYKQLNESEKNIYRAMFHAAINDSTSFYVKQMYDSEMFYKARDSFLRDFPEFYFMHECEKIIRFNDDIHSYRCSAYDFNEGDILENKEKIKKSVLDFINSLDTTNDVETCYEIYNYVIENTTYDMEYIDYQDIRGTLLHNTGVCATYAYTFQYLCNILGIDCIYISGDATDEEGKHAWCAVSLYGNWYWVDPTWGDKPPKTTDTSMMISDPYIDTVNLFYLFTPNDLFLHNHFLVDDFQYPDIHDNSLFFYYNDGFCHDYFDEEKLIEDICYFNKIKKNSFYIIYDNYENCPAVLDMNEIANKAEEKINKKLFFNKKIKVGVADFFQDVNNNICGYKIAFY